MIPSRVKVILISLAILLVLVAKVLNAVELCEKPDMRIDQRPGHGGPPIEITLGIFVNDITEIDDVAQTIAGDFITEIGWTDHRLADKAGCRIPLSKVWNPQLELLNSATLSPKRKYQKDQVEVKEGGRIHYYQRYFGSISTYHHLAEFPFDRQNFKLWITSFNYTATEVILVPDHRGSRLSELVNIADWTIDKVKGTAETVHIEEFKSPRSVFTLEIPASRNSSFYVWKVLVPLTLIVMMSWVVFWINPVRFGPQLGLSATAMLTLIAFQFAQTGVLPRLSYFTTMDKLILGSSLLVFLSFFESALAIYMVSIGKEKAAIGMDRYCRILFPLVFTIFWITVIDLT